MISGPEASYRVRGGTPLHGTVFVQGAKNAALKMIAASLLTANGHTVLRNVPAIERRGSGFPEMRELFFDLGFLDLQFAVFPERLIAGIDDDEAVVAIEQHVVAGGKLRADVVQAHDGGNAHHAGDPDLRRGIRGAG